MAGLAAVAQTSVDASGSGLGGGYRFEPADLNRSALVACIVAVWALQLWWPPVSTNRAASSSSVMGEGSAMSGSRLLLSAGLPEATARTCLAPPRVLCRVRRRVRRLFAQRASG